MTSDTNGSALAEIERRTAHVAIKIRQALAAFLSSELDTVRAMTHAEALAEQQERGYRPSLWEIERYAGAWRDLAPKSSAGRARLVAELAERHQFRLQDVPAIGAALHLDDPAVTEAHAALFGQPLERRYAAQTRLHDAQHSVSFDGWNERALGALLREVEWVTLDKGDVLFQRGQAGDGLYIVVSGHLRAFVLEADGREVLVGEMGHGESVGEMGLISGVAHSATIYASRDSELVKLTPHLFHRMVREHPEFLLHLTREVVDRLRESHRGRQTVAPLRAIAVLPAGRAPRSADGAAFQGDFCARFATALGALGSVRHVHRAGVDSQLGEGTAAGLDHDPHNPRLLEWLDALESDHDLVLYEADSQLPGWTDRCVHESDYVLFVARAADDPTPNPLERALPPADPHTSRGRALALVHAPRSAAPRDTARWLEARNVDTHFHVDEGEPADLRRLARGVTGRSVGVVLGGGGSRGFAHLGVLRALEECAIPIDAVGGASMGAIIGAQVALGWDYETMLAVGRRHYGRSASLSDLTPPLVSLFGGRQMGQLLREVYGDVRIEDLRIPFFCVSSSLTHGQVVVHRRGPLARYVRASGSVAGLLPPVAEPDGELLVDGGVLNNLPADVMRAASPHGTVVAVNVDPRVGLSSGLPYGESLSLPQLFASQLASRPPLIPSIAAILERVTMLGSIRQASVLEKTAINLYFHPPTDDVAFADNRALQTLAERGYRYALPLVQVWKEQHPEVVRTWS